MSEQALLFIPDISGFTEFVTNTEIEHSRHIIAELLELLIDANELDLTLAEIEGDALFLYKAGNLPSREAIFRQVERMFLDFHNHLLAYKFRRICRCGACMSAADLKLKFIVHAGEIDFIEVKDSRKPFGPNVVVAHRLLKNDVTAEEYALLSNDLHEKLQSDLSLQVRLHAGDAGEGSEDYDLGRVNYCYFPLHSLKEFITPSDAVEPGERVKSPWVHQMDIRAPIQDVYDMVSSFDKRKEWVNGVDEFEYEKDIVNRVGTMHKCVIDERDINFETITSDFGGRLVYGERTTDIPFADSLNTYHIMEPLNERRTRVTIEVHAVSASPIKRALVPMFKFLSWSRLKKQFDELKTAAELQFREQQSIQ